MHIYRPVLEACRDFICLGALMEPIAEQGQTISMLQSQISQIQRKAGRHRLLASERTTRQGSTDGQI